MHMHIAQVHVMYVTHIYTYLPTQQYIVKTGFAYLVSTMYFPTTQTEFSSHFLPFLMRGQRGVGVNKEFPFLPPLLGQTKKKNRILNCAAATTQLQSQRKGLEQRTNRYYQMPTSFLRVFLHWANSSSNNDVNIGLKKNHK